MEKGLKSKKGFSGVSLKPLPDLAPLSVKISNTLLDDVKRIYELKPFVEVLPIEIVLAGPGKSNTSSSFYIPKIART